MRRFFLLTLSLALLGCGSDHPTDPTSSLGGNWAGASGTVTVTLALHQSGSTLTGSGSFTDGGAFGSLSAEGSYTRPAASLVFTAAAGPARFDGSTADGHALTGTLRMSDGRQYDPFTLTRQ